MPSIIIRQAEEKDIPAVIALSRGFYKEDTNPGSFYYYSLLFWPELYLVALEGNESTDVSGKVQIEESRLIGYFIAGVVQSNRNVVWSLGMAVTKDYEESGVRSQMVLHMQPQLLKLGINMIRLYVPPDSRFRRMAMNWGFRIVDFCKDKMGPGQDQYLMEREVKRD